jgi:hypothetical protein
MLLYTEPQGSPEWHAARAGVITGSMFRTARERKRDGSLTAKARRYAFRLAVERISGRPMDDFGFETWQMRRGRELEPEARDAFERHSGLLVEPAGFITSDDARFGASADGFVGHDEGLEIKCLVSPDSLLDVLLSNDISDYMDQCQGGMWLTGRKAWHFVAYCPALASIGRALTRWRVPRDDEYIAKLAADLAAFEAHVHEFQRALTNPPTTA